MSQTGTGTQPEPGPEPGLAEESSTRERILDIALELFTEQGYERTSLRQIAERLGFSKAAIYYHFASKEDILIELHLRLHEFGRGALSGIDPAEMSPELAVGILDRLIDQILGHRPLFVLFERNQVALDELHRLRHDAAHEDVEALFQQVLSNPEIALARPRPDGMRPRGRHGRARSLGEDVPRRAVRGAGGPRTRRGSRRLDAGRFCLSVASRRVLRRKRS